MQNLVRYRTNLVHYRTMEALCRQNAVFRPLESWRLLAQAEMWHHKAEDEIASGSRGCDVPPPTASLARTGSLGDAGDPADRQRVVR
jgi:hypothetical protein